MANEDDQVTYQEIRKFLKDRDFSDKDIEIFFLSIDGNPKYNVVDSKDIEIKLDDDHDEDDKSSSSRPQTARSLFRAKSAANKNARARMAGEEVPEGEEDKKPENDPSQEILTGIGGNEFDV